MSQLQLDKIKSNLSNIGNDQIPLVLICCGSFSPITYLHLRIFEMAKDYFNHNPIHKYKIVGGIISPVSDAYGKSSLVAAPHRVEMCRLACEGHSFITVEPWEALKPEWTPTLEALKHFDDEIKKDPQCGNVKVMLLAGSDLVYGFQHAHIWNPEALKTLISSFGLVVIERNSQKPLEFEIFESNLLYPLKGHIYVVTQMVPSEVSSSKLRLLIRRGFSIKYLTSDKVIEYIESKNLYPRDMQ